MKTPVEKRKPSGIVDYISLALTTFGVGYIPGAPGTYGSAVGVGIYVALTKMVAAYTPINATEVLFANPGLRPSAQVFVGAVSAVCIVSILVLSLVGIWASGRTAAIFGNSDPSQAVVDEVMGQLVTFCFIPFGLGWQFILAGFLLFRLFDIWKPYPIRDLEILPGGLGICADDIVAGVYAGVCLAVGYAIYLWV
ncbi:MAG: phosphatidylglycerophosphatase A [Pyrinomonadaceae bacterium]